MFGSGRSHVPGVPHLRHEASQPQDMKQLLQYCKVPSKASTVQTHQRFEEREARKAQFTEDMFSLMGGGKNAPSGPTIFGAKGQGTAAREQAPKAKALCVEATNDAAAARLRNLERARQQTCPFGTQEDPAAKAPTLQPRLGGVPEAPSERARSAVFAEAQTQAKLIKGKGLGFATPFDEHGEVGIKSVGERPRAPRGSLVPSPPSQTPVLDARAEALTNKAKQQQRDENPLVGDYREPIGNVGKGKGLGHREQLMPEAQMQLLRQGVKSLTAEQAMHANTKVLAESNRERNKVSLIRFGD